MPKIEKGIPFPETTAKYTRYPWREMEVGDSFLAESQDNRNSLDQCGSRMGRLLGWKFCIRKTTEGYRVWRVS